MSRVVVRKGERFYDADGNFYCEAVVDCRTGEHIRHNQFRFAGDPPDDISDVRSFELLHRMRQKGT